MYLLMEISQSSVMTCQAYCHYSQQAWRHNLLLQNHLSNDNIKRWTFANHYIFAQLSSKLSAPNSRLLFSIDIDHR